LATLGAGAAAGVGAAAVAAGAADDASRFVGTTRSGASFAEADFVADFVVGFVVGFVAVAGRTAGAGFETAADLAAGAGRAPKSVAGFGADVAAGPDA
jgi:hypothetical protein